MTVGAVYRSFAATVVLLAISAPTATATGGAPKHLAPPGNPAVTEYMEDVPTAMGSAPPGSGGKPAQTLSPSQRRRLEHLGPNGKLLVGVVNETAPPTSKPAGAGTSPDAGRRTGAEAGRSETSASFRGSGSGSLASAVLGAATGQGGGGGMGVLLPALMAVGLLLVIVSTLRRREARRS